LISTSLSTDHTHTHTQHTHTHHTERERERERERQTQTHLDANSHEGTHIHSVYLYMHATFGAAPVWPTTQEKHNTCSTPRRTRCVRQEQHTHPPTHKHTHTHISFEKRAARKILPYRKDVDVDNKVLMARRSNSWIRRV
jgi:hypothetical protein